MAGKGVLIKAIDNAKNENKPGNYFNTSKCENQPGGVLEGTFRIKAIKNGKIRTVVTQEHLFGKRGA